MTTMRKQKINFRNNQNQSNDQCLHFTSFGQRWIGCSIAMWHTNIANANHIHRERNCDELWKTQFRCGVFCVRTGWLLLLLLELLWEIEKSVRFSRYDVLIFFLCFRSEDFKVFVSGNTHTHMQQTPKPTTLFAIALWLRLIGTFNLFYLASCLRFSAQSMDFNTVFCTLCTFPAVVVSIGDPKLLLLNDFFFFFFSNYSFFFPLFYFFFSCEDPNQQSRSHQILFFSIHCFILFVRSVFFCLCFHFYPCLPFETGHFSLASAVSMYIFWYLTTLAKIKVVNRVDKIGKQQKPPQMNAQFFICHVFVHIVCRV